MNQIATGEVVTAKDQAKAKRYCLQIREAWQKSVGGIIDTGRLLNEAKKEVGHGSWLWMFSGTNSDRVPFVPRTAQVIMAVAAHPLLSNTSHGSYLPASYRTLYDLSRIPDDILTKALADGRIRPETQRKDIKALLPRSIMRNEWRDAPADISRQVADDIVLGDFREMCADLPDASVDLIFTDPPYDRDSLALYEAAAEQAARVLRPGGSLIMYCGQYLIGDIIAASEAKRMRYWWAIACMHEGKKARMTEYGIVVHWKPLLWFVRGSRGDKHTFIDDITGTGREKDGHQWQQATGEAEYFIARLTPPQGLVVDFFCGSGTTPIAADRLGRKWRAYELDADTRNVAIARISTDRATREAKAA